MLIDTHSHLNFKAYDKDRDEVIQRSKDVVCIDVGTKFETSSNAIELANKYENIYAAIGMHPIHILSDFKFKTDENEGAFSPFGEEFDKERYLNLAKSSKVVAIGEIGLDYYYKPKTKARLEAFKEKQKKVFVSQLELAKELNLPVIIHCRMAHQDLFEILKEQDTRYKIQDTRYRQRGVVHCFTGSVEEMKQYLDLGFYIGLNGIIFKLNLDEAIKQCPLERILTETDCPYLTPPEEGKDKRNEPVYVKYVVSKIAELKGLTFEEVASATFKNAQSLFSLK